MPISIKKKPAKRKRAADKKASKAFKMPDLSNDPYFVRKAEEAKADLIKSGLVKP